MRKPLSDIHEEFVRDELASDKQTRAKGKHDL